MSGLNGGAHVPPDLRFRDGRRCPVCGGAEDDDRGQGRRCFGYLSPDGKYGNCTREEHAGGLPFHPESQTYGHLLGGPCDCGKQHGSDDGAARPRSNGRAAGKGKRARAVFKTPREAAAFLARKEGYTAAKAYRFPRADGSDCLIEYRFDGPKGKSYRPLHKVSGGWSFGDPEGPLPLYRAPDLGAADRVYVAEGPKCCDEMGRLGLAATTSSHGARSANKSDWSLLAGKAEVVILPDADPDGEHYAREVVGILAALEPPPEVVKVVRLPGLPDGGDVIDWASARPDPSEVVGLRAEIERLAAGATAEDLDAAAKQTPSGDRGAATAQAPTQDQLLISLAYGAELFHSPDGRAYARINRDGHRETHAIRGASFRRWLTRGHYLFTERAPSAEALQKAISVLEARAEFEGECLPVYTRLAGHADPADPDNMTYYLDLCDAEWRAVEITRGGWEVVGSADLPVRFRRAKGMQALPMPVRGGSVDELREFVNVADDAQWRLLIAVVTAYLRPIGPFPVALIGGEQGSAKSTTTRVIRGNVDPNATPLRSSPRDERDLMIGATNSWAVALDNVSGLSTWLSDAICRLATGGGFATRTLYENDEETFFDAVRPVILNGIEDVATRGDLLDRCVILQLPAIPEDRRREEAPMWRAFEAARPRILGALLDAVAGALRALPGVHLDRRPRMADFARWGEAVGRALGWPERQFLADYERNRAASTEIALEASPVAQALRDLMARTSAGPDGTTITWEGTATELLDQLTPLVSEATTRDKDWPKKSNSLSGKLRRIAPALRKVGIDVSFAPAERGRKKLITIVAGQPQQGGEGSSSSSSSSSSTEESEWISFDETNLSSFPRDDTPATPASSSDRNPSSSDRNPSSSGTRPTNRDNSHPGQDLARNGSPHDDGDNDLSRTSGVEREVFEL